VSGADVIVGGHSHTRLDHASRVNNVLILQAGAQLKDVGMLSLQVDNDAVVSYSDTLLELIAPTAPQQNSVAELADSLETVIQAKYGQVIGTVAEPWTRSYFTGSNEGNWICDRLRARYHSELAFVNAGGIRADLKPGPVTMLDIQEMLPFGNSVVTFESTGAELRRLAEEQVRACGGHAHGALEMSGMKILYKTNAGNSSLVSVSANDQPLDSARVYHCVSIDYVVSKWQEYFGFQPRSVDTTGDLLSDVIAEEIRIYKSPIHADATPRLVEEK
jgi:5'-nucleotidase / UDP-sugar diphosphatase